MLLGFRNLQCLKWPPGAKWRTTKLPVLYLNIFPPTAPSLTALQERIDKEVRGVTTETEAAAAATGANGVSDVTGSGEESSEGDGDNVEQVIDSVSRKLRLHIESQTRI